MSATSCNHSVLFIGSAPAKPAKAVFEAISEHVGDLTCAVPDGDQAGWIGAVYQRHLANPQIEVVGMIDFFEGGTLKMPLFRVKPGVKPGDLELGPFGFAEAARDSYAEFKRMRSEGRFAADARFQVCLPTPLLCLQSFKHPMAEFLPAAEAAMADELAAILKVVPAEDLAVQWDVCEPVFEEVVRRPGEAPSMYAWRDKADFPPLPAMLDSIARAAIKVPAGAGLGFHFCYGSAEDKHAVEPANTQLLVDFMNGIAERVSRPIDWMHFPVPIERDDLAYFAPLKGLKLHPETKLFLGLLHREDGTEGAARRITAAKSVISGFGVATECGLRDTRLEDYPAILDLHREAALLL